MYRIQKTCARSFSRVKAGPRQFDQETCSRTVMLATGNRSHNGRLRLVVNVKVLTSVFFGKFLQRDRRQMGGVQTKLACCIRRFRNSHVA